MEKSFFHRVHHRPIEHQMPAIAFRYQHALLTIQALLLAHLKPAFDFFVHAADGQDIAMLVQCARYRNALRERHLA